MGKTLSKKLEDLISDLQDLYEAGDMGLSGQGEVGRNG